MRPIEAMRRLLRACWVGGSEMLLAVALVVVLSLGLLGALVALFPRGTGLVDLYGGFAEQSPGGGRLQVLAEAVEPALATVTRVRRTVKDRPADAVVWHNSQEGLAVENRHAIQTSARSSALISIEGRGAIEIGENSLVVFRQPERGRRDARRGASITLLGGALSGRVATDSDSTDSINIVTAAATTTFRREGDEAAHYSVSVGPDDTATVTVFSGSGEVAGAGGPTALRPNEAVTVAPDGSVGPPRQVPPTPRALAPEDGQILSYSTRPPAVTFAWSAGGAAEHYRLQIAVDAAFEEIVFDDAIDAQVFRHGNLAEGDYHWRVTARNGNVSSLPSPARRLRLLRDAEPPALSVALSQDPGDPGRLIVEGQSEPGADVLFGEMAVSVSATGQFRFSTELQPGANRIVIEAIDALGNIAYFSQYVDSSGSSRRTP